MSDSERSSSTDEHEFEVTIHEVRRLKPGFYMNRTRVWYVDATGAQWLLCAPDAPLLLQPDGDELPRDAELVGRSGVRLVSRELAALVDRHFGSRRLAWPPGPGSTGGPH
ncbi:hypothetical protein [Nannocystis bainbridge]|uniref:hypothetical protein n=1 Tax=Nannocystis bainbridge TaxID=2995303 RepID=UPI00358DA52E